MTNLLLDTHAFIWYSENDPKLSEVLKTEIETSKEIDTEINMANPEHFKILLLQGVDEWNQWRKYQPKHTLFDLSGANLSSANLQGVNLQGANLRRDANLSRVNLQGANLSRTILRNANLQGANLKDAIFYRVVFKGVSLYGANLSGAKLQDVDLSGAILRTGVFSNVNFTDFNLNGFDFGNVNALKSGGVAAFEKVLDNPLGAFMKGAWEGWEKES